MHAAAQAVQDQGLVGLGDAQLPGQARILDGGAGAAPVAVVTGDKDDLRRPLATPAAMVPTPASLTSFTLMLAWRLAFFRS